MAPWLHRHIAVLSPYLSYKTGRFTSRIIPSNHLLSPYFQPAIVREEHRHAESLCCVSLLLLLGETLLIAIDTDVVVCILPLMLKPSTALVFLLCDYRACVLSHYYVSNLLGIQPIWNNFACTLFFFFQYIRVRARFICPLIAHGE